jgi:hypothetical protein
MFPALNFVSLEKSIQIVPSDHFSASSHTSFASAAFLVLWVARKAWATFAACQPKTTNTAYLFVMFIIMR